MVLIVFFSSSYSAGGHCRFRVGSTLVNSDELLIAATAKLRAVSLSIRTSSPVHSPNTHTFVHALVEAPGIHVTARKWQISFQGLVTLFEALLSGSCLLNSRSNRKVGNVWHHRQGRRPLASGERWRAPSSTIRAQDILYFDPHSVRNGDQACHPICFILQPQPLTRFVTIAHLAPSPLAIRSFRVARVLVPAVPRETNPSAARKTRSRPAAIDPPPIRFRCRSWESSRYVTEVGMRWQIWPVCAIPRLNGVQPSRATYALIATSLSP